MEGHVTGTSCSDSQPRLWMTSGRSMSVKSAKMTWRSEWTPRREKFSEKSFRASSSRNRIEEGVGSEEDDAPKRRGFWDGVDLRLGAIDTIKVNRREREREKERDNQKSPKHFKYTQILNARYVCMKMHKHVTCKVKSITGSAKSKPTNIQTVQHV